VVTTKPAAKSYIPDQGDLIWLNFAPQTGREQSGIRPALVLSPKSYNSLAGLAILCPITSKIKGYPFEVVLRNQKKVSGAILGDQIKNLDWRSRGAKFIAKAAPDIMDELLAKLKELLF
jgi:mRNA interferase MazF